MTYLDRAIQDGLVRFEQSGRYTSIVYKPLGFIFRYDDPEEQVRAEFWAELIYRYEYPAQRIGIEVTVPDRVPHDRADLVVFRDDDRKDPYAVIECKRDGITDAEFRQAVEQAFGNGHAHKFRAAYVMVVAGNTRRAYDSSDAFPVLEREANLVADLPVKYGKPSEFKYRKGGDPDIRVVDKEDLIATIQKCHQTLWGGGKLSPPAAFGELCKLIFVKIADEKATAKAYRKAKKPQPYQFQVRTREKPPDLAARIRALYEAERLKDRQVFDEPIKVADATLSLLVSHLEGVDLNDTDLDTKGVAFEQFMDGFFKGSYGQYFTPREVIAFAVEMVRPTNEDVVLDPACGSGGFLLHALDAVRREADELYPDHDTDAADARDHRTHWHDFAQRNLYGVEINDEIARVAKMNMILHDDGHTNVVGMDALVPLEELRGDTNNDGFRRGAFSLIVTNPPFGATIDALERPYLATYELGRQTDARGNVKVRKRQKSEVLFLERIADFLKPGTGRAAVVLPDGLLTNASLQYARDFLLDRFQLLGVVSLPQTAFAHYGAGVKSSVVFLRRRAPGEVPRDDEAVFMAEAEHVGYDASGRKTSRNDLPAIAEAYRAFEKDPAPFFV